MKRRWAVTGIAEGPEGAIRLTVMVDRDGDDHPGRVEEPIQAAYELQGEVGGIYRRRYQAWAASIRTSFTELESARNEEEAGGPISEEVTP